MNKIALCTIAVGENRFYFDSAHRYFPYNKKYFGQHHAVDYLLFTDRDESIDGMIKVNCEPSIWPYPTLLKNNIISDYFNREGKWNEYSNIFFIDADFVICAEYDFFAHNFLFLAPYWTGRNFGAFYGGKSEYFKHFCSLFYDEIKFIYDNKLPVPYEIDEFYINLFRKECRNNIHILNLIKDVNFEFFYDNENLDEKIQKCGNRLFMFPLKSKGRTNRTLLANYDNTEKECTINLNENYIFDNYTFAFGRLVKIDDTKYRILWSKNMEEREILNIKDRTITKG
jgi:hypothetical protein